jgi:N-acetylmuramoyl-L-alanine amidase
MTVDIHSWPLPPPSFPMTAREIGQITDIIVHHSAGRMDQTVMSIDIEHRGIGDAMIGYNYVIDGAGVIWNGRPLMVVPAAAYGRNAQSINICVIGQFEPDADGYTGPPKALQMDALEALLVLLHQHYPHIVRTIGHRDLAAMFYPGDEAEYATACPGLDLYRQLPALRARVARSINAR